MARVWFKRGMPPFLAALALAAALFSFLTPACAVRQASAPPSVPRATVAGIPKAEFAALVRDMSEEGGFFHSDNFTSNETSYLHVVSALQDVGATGGAYLGVGPEQNFTYIAKVRPEIAFIFDIRRQAVVQHLLYKAIFQLAESRGAFLSLLLSRPVGPETAESPAIETLLDALMRSPISPAVYAANRVKVEKLIQEDFGIALSAQDLQQLHYVYSTFQQEGLAIAFRFGPQNGGFGFRRFPDLRELILERDLDGKLGNFLTNDADYQFVRDLHRANRIVPIVGDFAGTKAIAAVGDYLRAKDLKLRAFYTSNVEQFLFQNGVVPGWAANVRQLPIDDKSVFIRAVPNRGQPHPAQIPGYRMTTLLQKVSVFLEDFDAGTYDDYRTLVNTHYIAGQPR